MTNARKGLIVCGVFIIFLLLLGGAIMGAFHKDKEFVREQKIGEKFPSSIRKQLLASKTGTIIVFKNGIIGVITNKPLEGGKVIYEMLSFPKSEVDEKLLSEKLFLVVDENNPKYAELAVCFINARTAFSNQD